MRASGDHRARADAPPATDQAPAEPAPVEPAPVTEPAAEPAAPTTPPIVSSNKNDAAWLLVGGCARVRHAGAVLAYSADSSEQDLARPLRRRSTASRRGSTRDTQKRYDELVAEGERYERLSWAAFGLAGAAHGDDLAAQRWTGDGARFDARDGVAATLRFELVDVTST